jgi:hypothetical protein
MLRYKFTITTCCGDHVDAIIFTLPVKADPWAYREMAIERAGYNQFQCPQCYSPGYLVTIDELD